MANAFHLVHLAQGISHFNVPISNLETLLINFIYFLNFLK